MRRTGEAVQISTGDTDYPLASLLVSSPESSLESLDSITFPEPVIQHVVLEPYFIQYDHTDWEHVNGEQVKRQVYIENLKARKICEWFQDGVLAKEMAQKAHIEALDMGAQKARFQPNHTHMLRLLSQNLKTTYHAWTRRFDRHACMCSSTWHKQKDHSFEFNGKFLWSLHHGHERVTPLVSLSNQDSHFIAVHIIFFFLIPMIGLTNHMDIPLVFQRFTPLVSLSIELRQQWYIYTFNG
ncbi:hypothetical protein HD554DRAFT_2042492 [Boletus coccyginus]|nr:hypothetical protein HD554DRAFT_2042492 [Boletus coccyginus]